MAKPIEDRGHKAEATKPLQIKRYEAGKLPDPGQCIDCIIVVNDRLDGQPRARLAMSNGAAWDHLAWMDDAKVGVHSARPAAVDLMPMIREAVDAALPDRTQAPPRLVIESTAQQVTHNTDDNSKLIADAMLEMSDHVTRMQRENADLMARVEFLEKYAVAKVNIS